MLFNETRIYQRALELIELTGSVIEELPPGFAFLGDQLRRASASILLNFSEGCGKSSTRDRRRYFHTARGSAYEVLAAADVAHRFGALSATRREATREVADHIAAMLTRYR